MHQINTSDGGVPKRPVDRAVVGLRGLEGDRQADRKHHGHPSQALSLWSLEVIRSLQEEGHAIEPGFAGENLTISGIDWGAMQPGVTLRIGAEIVAVISDYATPCSKNAGWFADRNFRRMSQELHPGWSRIYASVAEGGTVAVGDPVIVDFA